ncbi:MAG: transglutaminase domain-containing protein, partial [Euryarchaeota archaeon]|nr:transglutaminase domain-containing protein [Euryarchaeota archaeon]
FALTKIILTHPVTFVRNRKMRPDEQRYVRPPRRYELPVFREGMKYSTSNEPYLRPTLHCNPREHEIIAMAHELGAYELPDREFAEAAYWFCKDNIQFEMCALDSAGMTLKRGTGTCFHYISLFNALCRAAGIKARYKLFAMNYDRYSGGRGGGVDPIWEGLYNTLGYLMSEAEAEVYVDGEWTVAHPATSAGLQAAQWLPITKLGEDSIGLFFDAVPGTIQRVESVPRGMDRGMRILLWLAPASPERVAIAYQNAAMYGQQVIAEAGGREAYDRMARERMKLSSPTVEAKGETVLVFEE